MPPPNLFTLPLDTNLENELLFKPYLKEPKKINQKKSSKTPLKRKKKKIKKNLKKLKNKKKSFKI